MKKLIAILIFACCSSGLAQSNCKGFDLYADPTYNLLPVVITWEDDSTQIVSKFKKAEFHVVLQKDGSVKGYSRYKGAHSRIFEIKLKTGKLDYVSIKTEILDPVSFQKVWYSDVDYYNTFKLIKSSEGEGPYGWTERDYEITCEDKTIHLSMSYLGDDAKSYTKTFFYINR